MKVNYWTKREVDILKMYYFNSTATELKALLHQRDINSIRKKARSLGMYVPPSLEFKNRSNAHTGENSYQWKGGRKITPKGYVQILKKGHPRADSNGYVLEHILVWEKYTGMQIPDGMVIHHLDGNKTNNHISNLCLMTFGGHSTYHNTHRKGKI